MKRKPLVIFILFLLIASYSISVYALDEFIDDYTNYNNVQARNNIVRNVAFNCMELDYISSGNFLGYTEIDVIGNYITLTLNRVEWNSQTRLDDTRIYRDYGVGYFGDFSMDFDMEYTNVEAGDASHSMINTPFAMSNSNGDWDAIWGSSTLLIYASQEDNNDDRIRLSLYARSGGATIGSAIGIVRNLAKYYVTMSRVGALFKGQFYSDEARTVLVFQLSCDAPLTTLRYLQFAMSRNHATDGSDHSTGYVEYGAGYEDNGYYYTTEIASGVGGTIIGLLLNTTISVGDSITVEFSNDNITYVNHDGNVGGDTVISGNETIDLRDLSYTLCTVRLNLTDGGADSTPRVYELWLITSAVVGGGAMIYPLVLYGIVIIFLLTVGVALAKKKRMI